MIIILFKELEADTSPFLTHCIFMNEYSLSRVKIELEGMYIMDC